MLKDKTKIFSILAVIVLALVSIIFFAPDDIDGNVLQQHDILQGLANGQETQQYQEATGHASRWTNALFSGMPTFQISPTYQANSMMEWIFCLYTLWLPSPANLLFAMMLGFFIMALCMKMRWPVALFAAIAWGFSSYFIIIIGAGHIWKFLTLAYIPPTIGGLALLYRRKYLSGTALTALFAALQLQSNHPQMTYYFLFPILFLVIARGVSAYRLHEMPAFWKGTGCAVLAAVLAVAANSASLYNSYLYSKETIRGRATDLVDPSAPSADGADHDYITAWSYGIDETWTLLIPNVKGGATIKPVAGQNSMLSLADTNLDAGTYLSPQETQFLSQFPQYFGDQPMTNGPVYVGAIVLLLAIIAMFTVNGRVTGPLKWALFASCILSILLSWGHNFAPLTDFFIDHFPGYNKFRTPASILVVTEFCLPLLAAMALMKMIENRDDYLQKYKAIFFGVFGIGALICLIGWIAPSVFGTPYSASEINQLKEMGIFSDPTYSNIFSAVSNARLHLVSADSLRSLMYIIVGFLVIFLYLKGALSNKVVFMSALSAVMLIDLFSVNKRYVNSENFVEPLRQESFTATDADRHILTDTTYYRVMDIADNSGARSSYFHHTIGGYHAAKLTRYNDLLTTLIEPARTHLATEAQTNYQRINTLLADSTSEVNPDSMRLFTSDVPVLDMLNTKYFIMGDYAEENPNALGNAWWVSKIDYVADANAEMAALAKINPATTAVADRSFEKILGTPSAPAPGDTIYLSSYAPDRLAYKVRSAKGGIAVFSEVFFPWGWKAIVNGEEAPIARVDYTLRAMRLPAGSYDVEMSFNPESLRVTNTAGVISVILIYILCLGALAVVALPSLRRKKGV
ncbi:MAG: hypothetical protein K2H35_05925 [Muribaculaceae bacterium]|nr:hypothetical protein [Muribaculaceae bacterium]